MPVNELYLVRHGESIGNVAATQAEVDQLDAITIDIRDADVPLSPTGEEQARALSEWLAEQRGSIDLYWVSPYLRARQTLEKAMSFQPSLSLTRCVTEAFRTVFAAAKSSSSGSGSPRSRYRKSMTTASCATRSAVSPSAAIASPRNDRSLRATSAHDSPPGGRW